MSDSVRETANPPRKQIDPERRAEVGRERRTRTRARIIAAAFEVLGDERGLHARAEDVADKASVTRATFYNHFAGMAELREALSVELTHDFLGAVTATISALPDARDRSALAVRFYLQRAAADRRWAWSMINLSATGLIFGVETFRQAEQTLREGVSEGVFPHISVPLGRDLLLGATLAAMGSIVRGGVAADYPDEVAGAILFALGVAREEAEARARAPLPKLVRAG
jgi:AcrR family transcriptional regulator